MTSKRDAGDILQEDGTEGLRSRLDQDIGNKGKANGKTRYKIEDVHQVFLKWLGKKYDLATLNATLAVTASEQLSGDPAWLLIISGSGNAKTETVQATSGVDARVVSTISSIGALLSATSQKQRAKGASGGLLREIGERGILAIKDMTSILSIDRNVRNSILSAFREIHDGHWVRDVGSDGGRKLSWQGRIVVIGACTTAWDHAHAVIANMGERFVIIRSDSHLGRKESGQQAIRNTGKEAAMRKELADAVGGLMSTINTRKPYKLTDEDEEAIVKAAELVTLARTGVDLDYRGDVIDAHAPEMPTRLAKQLTQIMRGAVAIGMQSEAALALALRCARDSMPPLRLTVLRDLAENGESKVHEIRERLQKPRATIDRTLQALHILGLLICREDEEERGKRTVEVRYYDLAPGVSVLEL
jgi:hypothetical protein